MIHLPDLHYIDAVGTGRGDLNELTAYIGAGAVELVALQRGDDENRDTFPPHSQRHKLHSEGLACATGAENRHICVLVHRTVKDIHDNQRTVVLVHTQQNAVVIAHLVTGKGVAACGAAGQQIPLTALI